MRIPKRFKLHGETISIIFSDRIGSNNDADGLASHRFNEIILTKDALNKKYLEKVFCHEMIHYILEHMEETELNKDEKFVSLFSNLLYQAIETMEY